jgi:hypothetical protein
MGEDGAREKMIEGSLSLCWSVDRLMNMFNEFNVVCEEQLVLGQYIMSVYSK